MRVSVILPVLNEAEHLSNTLASVRVQPPPIEIIVVDGGSTDGTRQLAMQALRGMDRRRRSGRVMEASTGRAAQMNAGAQIATGEILLFLHADTCLPQNALNHVRTTLHAPDVAAGCFRLRFDDASNPWMRLWEAPLWMRWRRLAFGDRALFVHRRTFEAVGGFPEQPLFEDLDLVQRLRSQGGFAFLDAAVITSARRFIRHGALRQQLRNLVLWSAWMMGVSPRHLVSLYPEVR